ncbi:isochorismatase family protein [Pseudoduganella ginsengisoli]|nr:cysteine hydrolase family protein [Pseudoduganella ginsengisoli]
MTQTIRSIAGIAPVSQLNPAATALVLIDFQNEYYDGKLPIPDGLPAARNAARLVAWADRLGMPVFHVQHVGAATGALFAAGSHAGEIHPLLAPAPHHHIVAKDRVASFAGTDLHAQLQGLGINTLIVAGLMTHMCVSTAVREARSFGASSYKVVVAADASATRDISDWNGDVVAHAGLHRATLTALHDNFADVRNTGAILELPVSAN